MSPLGCVAQHWGLAQPGLGVDPHAPCRARRARDEVPTARCRRPQTLYRAAVPCVTNPALDRLLGRGEFAEVRYGGIRVDSHETTLDAVATKTAVSMIVYERPTSKHMTAG